MDLKQKTITFHINNSAYTVDIGPDFNDEIKTGLEKFLDLNNNITTETLLLAYLQKTQEHINFKNDVENNIQNLINFKNTTIK